MVASELQKKGPQGPQNFSTLKSLQIYNDPPIPNLFTPVTIKNGFFVKF